MDTKQLITGNPKEGFYPIVQDTVTVIELNEAVMNLTNESSSEDITAAFDSVEDFTTLLQNVRNTENIINGVLINNSSLIGKFSCNILAHATQEILYIDGVFTDQYFNITITNTDGTFSCVKNVVYLNREVGDKTNVLILSLENDLANGQKDSPVEAEVSTALKDAISNGKACVIKSANSDILANLQQISDNVTIVMEQISRVGQTFVAVNTSITVNTATNIISDYQTGALVLETGGDGNKFLSNDGKYKEIPQPDLTNYLAKDNTTEFTPTDDYQPATKKYVDDHNSNYPGGILNIGVNSVSYDEDIINYGYLVIFLSGFGNIIIPIRISGDKISEYKTLISISDSVGVGESAYSLAQVTMSNLTKNANKYEGTINVAYLHRIIRESDYNDLGTAPETDDVLYFVIPD